MWIGYTLDSLSISVKCFSEICTYLVLDNFTVVRLLKSHLYVPVEEDASMKISSSFHVAASLKRAEVRSHQLIDQSHSLNFLVLFTSNSFNLIKENDLSSWYNLLGLL